MTFTTFSDDSFQPDQVLSHADIFAQTGNGKSILVTQAQVDELLNNPQSPKA